MENNQSTAWDRGVVLVSVVEKLRYAEKGLELKLVSLNNTDICAIVDDEDFDWLSAYAWYLAPDGYVVRPVRQGRRTRTTVRMHKMLLSDKFGYDVDHINRVKWDNRKGNLRHATRGQNLRNVPKTDKPCSSIYKGVSFCKSKRKWRACIVKNYKQLHIGYFNTQEQAALAYNFKATEIDGEYAYLNIVQ